MFKDEIPANREQSKQQHFKVVATLSNFFSLPFFSFCRCSSRASFFAPFVLAFGSACSNKNKRIPSHPPTPISALRPPILFVWFLVPFIFWALPSREARTRRHGQRLLGWQCEVASWRGSPINHPTPLKTSHFYSFNLLLLYIYFMT